MCADPRRAGRMPRSSSSAASATVRASGPCTVMPKKLSASGQVEIRPRCGLIPTRLVHDAGIRTEPAPSEPDRRRHQACRHRCGATARRAARRAVATPRVAGVSERPPVGERPLTQFAAVRLADDHRPGLPQSPHHLGVAGLHREIARAAERGRFARDVGVVLHVFFFFFCSRRTTSASRAGTWSIAVQPNAVGSPRRRCRPSPRSAHPVAEGAHPPRAGGPPRRPRRGRPRGARSGTR